MTKNIEYLFISYFLFLPLLLSKGLIEANTTAPSVEGRKYFIERSTPRETWDKIPSEVQSNFHDLGEEDWYAEVMAGQVLIEGFWDLSFMVSCGKGTLAQNLPGQWTLCCWKGFSVHIQAMSQFFDSSPKKLWFQLLFEVKIFSSCLSYGCMT